MSSRSKLVASANEFAIRTTRSIMQTSITHSVRSAKSPTTSRIERDASAVITTSAPAASGAQVRLRMPNSLRPMIATGS